MRKLIVLELFSRKRVQSFRSLREEEVGLLIDSVCMHGFKIVILFWQN